MSEVHAGNLDELDLPDDVRDEIAPHVAPSPATLDSISVAISARRDEAKAARTSSGIEQVWKECEEAYVGIDDANRSEFQDARWSKPMSMDGPVTTGKGQPSPSHKSTAFVRLTARYVDAGAAKLGEILLPPDDKAFSFTETPVPDLIKAKDNNSQVVHDGMGNAPLMRPAKPGEVPPAAAAPAPAPTMAASLPAGLSAPVATATQAQPQDMRAGLPLPGAPAQAGPPMVPLTVKDLAEEAIELARKKAKAAEKRIYDWMVECQHTAEVRKVIFDGARIGVGVLKGPFPKNRRNIALQSGKAEGDDSASKGNLVLEVQDRIMPCTAWVDPWNCFPDSACGENIHNGDFFFERDHISDRQLRDLKKIPDYIASQIDKVIAEGPANASNDDAANGGNDQKKSDRKGRYEIWYYYGTLTRAEMSCIRTAANKPLSETEVPPERDMVYAIVTMVNSTIVRATINPLDSGSFPYHSFPWQRRAGHWAGIGVAEQVRMPQKTCNAATRSMLNNAGKSSGSQIVVDQSCIKPADGQWAMTPDKVWYKTGDSTGGDVKQAFAMFQTPNVTDQLMKIINYPLQLAEESTSIPLITQGQSGPTTPDTFGAAQLQDNNANQLLRSIGYTFDDHITEPVVRQFYEWLLLDPDVPDDEKGDFNINAHGSVALVERAIQDQTIAQIGPLTLNPAYGGDPKKWYAQYLKSKRLDPKDFQYSDEQQAKMDAAGPPDTPVVAAAKVRAASAEKIATGEQALEQQSQQNDQHETLTDATVELHKLSLQRELAMLEYANKNSISLNSVKGELAKTAMQLQTERQLNAQNNRQPKSPQPRPAVQAPGRAAPGHAADQSTAA